MTPDLPTERKSVIQPTGVAQILLQGFAGHAVRIDSGQQNDLQKILGDLSLEEREFPEGDEGIRAKQEFSTQGGVIVQRAVFAVKKDMDAILVTQRQQATHGSPGHRIVSGGSILISGSPQATASEVLAKKAELSVPPASEELFALSIGDPKVSKGIYYLFLVHRTQLAFATTVKSRTQDTVAFKRRGRARLLIGDKTMEHSVLDLLNK